MNANYRLNAANGGRFWFATFEEAKKAQRKHKGRIFMLVPGADAGVISNWVEL